MIYITKDGSILEPARAYAAEAAEAAEADAADGTTKIIEEQKQELKRLLEEKCST
jgi:hypothetical protein